MKKLSKILESTWGDIARRAEGEQVRREDIPEQDYEYWWRNIPLDNAPKYKKEELRLYDFLYNLIIFPLEKTMNIRTPEAIHIYFKYEDAWYLSIYHNTTHGADNYTMEAKGVRGYNPQKYSELDLSKKRGIKYRLETKTFYIYTYKNGYYTEYTLREDSEYKGEKGILLK